MSLFKRVAAAWDRVVSGPQFGRSDDDFVQLDLELLEDRRLLSAGLTAAFTAGVLTITDSTADGEDVEIRVDGDILSIFDMSPGGGGSPVPLQIDINGNGIDAGDPTFLDLSAGPALTQINVNFNVGSDRLSAPLLDGVGLNVQGGVGTDFVRIFDVGGVHDAGISGQVEIHAETIEISSGHYDSLAVWLDGNVQSHDGVNWHASSFDIDGNLELDGNAEFSAATNGSGTFDVSGSVIEHAGGIAGPSSLTATGWNSLDLHGPVTLDGDLDISATTAHLHSATTLGGDLSMTSADLDIDVAVSADEVTLIGNDIDIGAGGSIHAAKTTLAPLDTSYGLHIGEADGVNFVGIDLTELGKIDSPTIHFGDLSTLVSLQTQTTLATGREWELASLSLAAGINLTVDGLLDGNLAMLAGAVLSGRGTVSGNVTGTGNVAPGGANGAGFGVLSVGGDFNINGQLRLDVNSPWNVPGTNHDQLVVGGVLNLATTSLVFSNTASVAPTAQQVVTLIRHDGAATTTAAATHPQGTSFTIGGRAFRPYYNGGDGNDVVLVEASTPTIAYAEDTAWSALTPGTVIADADLGAAGAQPAVYGVNAFSSVTAALAAVTTTGRVIVNDGTYAEAVTIQNSRILATSANSNVTINSLATAATTGQIEINGQRLTIGDSTSTLISGIISGPGAFTKTGSGTVTISGANTYAGTTTIDNGTLQLGAANVIPDGVGKGNVVINSTGTLALGATTSETINGLSGSGKVDHLAAGTATLTIGGGDQSSTFSGQIINTVGTVNLAKTGTGTIVLSGSNSFSGTTTVGTGTLEVSGSLSGAGAKSVSVGATLTVTSPGIVQGAVTVAGLLNGSGTLGGNLTISNLGLREGAGTINGTVTVNSGGTLGGTGSIVGAITVNSGGKLAPGSGGTGTLNVGNVTFANGSQFVVEIESTGVFNDRLNASGTVTIGSTASLVLIDAGTGTIAPRQSVEILSKSTGTVSGTFSGGADGQLLTVSGTQYRVYYNGGDGNDVVLIRNVTPLPVVYVSTAFTGPAGTTVDSDPNTAGIQEATIGIDAFSTMVPALAAVDPLGTVRVFAGTYYHTGTLVISKSVTIEGAGMDSTQMRRAGAPVGNFDVAVQITANDVTIKNVQLGWETHSQVAFNAAVDYKGYVVVTNADRTTISSVRFGDNTTREGYRSAVVFEGSGANGADYLTVRDSIFEGRWGRALIRDGNNGSGEHFLITHNEFREYHYRWGPIGVGPQDDGGTANNFAYSGEISFNYFGNRVEAGAFQEAGDQNFTVTITNKGITADGVQIVHNTFDWQDADTVNQSGKKVQAVGVYFEPSLTVTSTTDIRDNIFNGFQYNGLQPTAEQPLWHQNGGVSFDNGNTYTGSIEFDGVNDFGMFTMPDDVGDKGTLSFWVQIDDAGMNRRNEFFEGPGNAGLEMQYNGGSGTGVVYGRTTTVGGDFVIRSGGDKALLDSNLTGQSTNWHNIQYTWDKSTGEMRIYIDGAETTYAGGSTPTDLVWAAAVNTINQLMNVGRDGSGDTTRFLDGQMDDIAWFNEVLTATERNEIRTDGVNAHAGALAGKLVVHWDFDAAPTGKVFYDTVNNTQLIMSTDGIVPFGPTYHATGGPIGNSGTLEFDGTDDFATFRSADFDVGESGTLSFWVQMDDTSRRNQFFEGPGNTGMEFQYRNNSGGQVYGRTSDNGDFVIRSGSDAALMNSVLPGQTTNWHNVQYTWDYNASNGTGKMHIYIDGVETGYASTFTPADLNWTTIVNTVNGMMNVGRDPGDTTRYFNGQMDDIAFYKGVLDTNELNGIRTQGVGNYAVDNTLVASWNFDSAPNSDGTFNGSNGTSIKLYVQQLVPDPPIYGYGLIGPAGADVNHNLFYNNDRASNLTLNPASGNRVSNEVGLNPLLDPLFQRTGATLEEQYTLRFGSGAAYFSSEFLSGNVATPTPHIGAYQDDPVSVATNDVLVAGTDDDDLLVVTFTSEDAGYFVLTRHVGMVNQDVLGPINFTDLNKLTFEGFDGDDVLIIQQPTGTLYSVTDGILFEGGTENNDGNALTSDGLTGGDTLVLLAQDGTVIDSSAYVFLDASSAGNHNGSITVIDGALSTVITFHDSDAIRDNLNVDARSFTYSSTAASETITLLAPGDIVTLAGFPPTANIGPVTLANKITSNRGPAVSFANPNASLAINAGQGDDTVNVTSVDGAYVASLSIDAGAGNDVIVVTTDLNLGSTTSPGQLTLTAERIDIGANITTTGQQTYNGPVVLTKSVTLTLAGSDTASIDLDSVDGNGFHLTISSTGSVVASGTIDLTNGVNPSGDLSVTFDADGDSVNTATLVDIAAGKVTVTTGGGCDDTLTLNGAVTATADVDLTAIGTINVNGPILTTTGDITLDACIDIALAAAADLTTGGGYVSLTAGRDITGAAGADISTAADAAGNVTVTADRNISLAGAIKAAGAGLLVGDGGDVQIQTLNGTIALADVIATATAPGIAGNVTIQSRGTGLGTGNNVVLNGHVSTSSGGTVRIESSGAIVDGSLVEGSDITATNVLLRASTGIGSGTAGNVGDLDLVMAAGSTTLSLAAVTNSGDINLHATGPLTITGVTGATIGTDSITAFAGVAILDNGAANGGGRLTVTSTSNLTVAAGAPVFNDDAGSITLASQGSVSDLSINSNVTATGGSGGVTLLAGHDVLLNGTVTVSATGAATILIAAGEDFANGTPQAGSADGDVRMADGTTVSVTGGTATIRATTDVILSGVSATTVRITADSNQFGLANGIGEIVDNLSGEGANITASTAILRAGSGIGNFSYGTASEEDRDIDVEVQTLAALTGTGDLFVTDASSVTIATLDGLTNGVEISGGSGDLLVRAAGAMTVNTAAVQSGTGSATLAAGIGGIAGSLDLNANVTSTTGHNRLTARDGINVNGAVQVSTTGGDIEIHAGRLFQFNQTLAAGGASSNLTMATDVQVTNGGTGNAILTATGDVSISRVAAGTGTVYVVADSDSSGSGAIVDSRALNGAGNINITATAASLRAGSGIGQSDAIDLSVSTVAAETDSGSIRLDNTSSLTIGTVVQRAFSVDLTTGSYGEVGGGDIAALSGLQIRDAAGVGVDGQDAGTGAIVVQATGAIAVDNAILNGDAGDIALDADGAGVTLSAAVTSENDAGTVTGTTRISADGDVTQSTAGIIRTANLGVWTTAGQIDLLVAQNDVDTLSAVTAGGDISYRDADGFQLSLVTTLVDAAFDTSAIYTATSGLSAPGGTIRLVGEGTAGTAAANSITQDGVNGPITAAALGIRLTGGDVLLDPNSGSSINDVDTLAIRVTPSAGLGGNVDFSDADDLTIGTVLSGGHANFADTSGIATQTGDIDVRTINGTMTVAQAVSTTGLGTIRLDANGTNSDLVVQAKITSESGAITLEADDSVTFTSAGDVSSTSGNITVTANADGTAGDGAVSGSTLSTDEIFMADGAVIDAGSGRIILSTAGTGGGHVTIGQLITTNSGTLTPAVQITSQQQVRDGGDTGGEDIIAATGRLVIDAQTGVGNSTVAGATAAIETRVASLDLQNRVSGNVDLLETNNLDVIRIAQQLAAGSEDGTAFVTLATTAGSIVLVDSTSGGSGVAARRGQVTLQAGGAAGDITLNSGITTKGGDVRLEAGDDIRSTAGDDITTTDNAGAAGASGAVVLLAHAGTADGGAAGVIDLAGDVITSGSADQNAGDITITNDDGTIAVTSLLARGGIAGAGGAAGNVSLFADDLGGDDSHNITLNRQIVARAGGASVLHGQVQIVADGAIVDSDETALDIDAGSVRLVATTGIAGNTGLDGDNRALEINADTLAATTVTGSIVLCDEAGGLTIGTVAGTSGVTVTGAGGGQIVIEVEGAGSALVVNTQISTAGTTASSATIDLSATGITLATVAADVIAAAGEITLDANSGSFASVAGAVVTSPAIVRISADTIDLQGTVHSDVLVRLAADTASTAINLGTGANGAGGFALDEVELNNIEAPIVRIGTAGADTVELCDGSSVALWAGPTTGAITFTGAFTSDGLFGTNFLELFTRSSVTATAGGVDLSAATTDLVIRAGAAVNFANDAHDLQTVAVVTNNNAGSTLTNSAITLRDTAGMTIGTVDGLSGLTTAGGAISVTTLGSAADLQVEQAVTNTGSNAISLVAGHHINFTASGDVTTQGGPVTVTADAFSVANTGGAITMEDGTVIQGTTANITLTADGDIRLGQLLTGSTTGNVTVTTTSGAIRDNTAAEASANNATNANIVGNIVSLSAATGIGSGSASLGDAADIDINAQSLSAVNTLSGAIQIFETDSVALRDLSATDTVSNVGRTIVIDAAGAITDFTPGADAQANITGGAVTLRATTGIGSDDDLETEISQLTATNSVSGNIQVSEINLPGSNGLEILAVSNQTGNIVIQTLDGPLTVSGPVSTTGAGLIDLRAGNADAPAGETLLVNSSLVTQGGRITLTADGGDIRFTANGDVTTTSGNVTVSASAAVDQQNGSIINAGTGLITILGGGDVTLARLVTTNTTDSAVSVTSAFGGIVKAGGSGENIGASGGLISLTAANGIGSATAIGIEAARLRAINTAAGDVRIAETSGVDIKGISQFGPGLIDLSAGGTVVISAGATVQAANGSITMQASGAIDMQDTSLVDAGTGRITVVAAGDVGLSLVRTVGDGVTTGVASIVSTFGQIRDNDLTGALDVQAASLAMTAAAGIGNGNPIETSVANLAALAQSGSILVTNSTGGAALNITSVAGVTGLTNNDTAGGNIIITHDGPMNITAPVQSSALFGTSPEQGVVRFSTATASAVDGDITVNSWINAPRARLDIAASGDVAINDAFVAVDVLAASVQVAAGTNDPTGSTTHGITVAPGTVISSSTGSVNDVIPRLDNFVASQVTALGVARIDFDYGRAPDEVSFTLIIDWGDGTRDVVTLPGGTPGHATFEHTYAGNPNAGNPAAPIPVTVTVLNDDNITFLVAGTEVDFNTQTEENAVPGDGLQTAIVYDLAIVVPDLETPRTIVADSQHASVQAITQLTTTVDLATAVDVKATVEGRIVIAHRLGLDGKPLTDADGNPVQVVFTEEQTALFLADLGKLYQSLDSGKFRIYVQEGDGRPLLVSVVTLRSGVPVTGNEATLDRPPTSDSDAGEMGGEEDDDADLNMVVPPPPPLPSLVQGEGEREPLARAAVPSRGLLAMVGHYLKNLGLM